MISNCVDAIRCSHEWTKAKLGLLAALLSIAGAGEAKALDPDHVRALPKSDGPLQVQIGFHVFDITDISEKDETIDFNGAVYMRLERSQTGVRSGRLRVLELKTSLQGIPRVLRPDSIRGCSPSKRFFKGGDHTSTSRTLSAIVRLATWQSPCGPTGPWSTRITSELKPKPR